MGDQEEEEEEEEDRVPSAVMGQRRQQSFNKSEDTVVFVSFSVFLVFLLFPFLFCDHKGQTTGAYCSSNTAGSFTVPHTRRKAQNIMGNADAN